MHTAAKVLLLCGATFLTHALSVDVSSQPGLYARRAWNASDVNGRNRTCCPSGAKGMINVNDQRKFIGNVNVGGQDLLMEYDTTTSDFWVINARYSNDAPNGGFSPWDSYTYNKTGRSTHLGYYKGEVSGERGNENIEIGGVDVGTHNIVVANQFSDEISHDSVRDGVIGLRFGRKHRHKTYKNNFLRVIEDDMDPVFTIEMGKNDSGIITFGEIDKRYDEKDIHYAPVNPNNKKWYVGGWFKDFTFGPQGSKPFHCSSCQNLAEIDTTSPYILLSKSAVEQYYRDIPDAMWNGEWWTIPCDGSSVLPDFSLYWGEDRFPAVVPGKDLGPFHTNVNTCVGGIQQNTNGMSFLGRWTKQVLGYPFIKQFFVVFDYDKSHTRIGLANKKDSVKHKDEESCPLANKSCSAHD